MAKLSISFRYLSKKLKIPGRWDVVGEFQPADPRSSDLLAQKGQLTFDRSPRILSRKNCLFGRALKRIGIPVGGEMAGARFCEHCGVRMKIGETPIIVPMSVIDKMTGEF